MKRAFRIICSLLPVVILGLCVSTGAPGDAGSKVFRAGSAVEDITPQVFPVRVNGMFTERTADKAVDSLCARALALDDGTVRLVICVVDTCMMPQDLIDDAKSRAAAVTGLPVDRMLVSATHTHSAPAAMACLGSRADPAYAAWLPGRIAAAIIAAVQNLQPARVGWTAYDDPEHTHNRRWIRRPDRLLNDPFGQPTVRANMHPGHQSPDVTGPSGPVDPQVTMLAVETLEGRPLGLLANYSMHYQSSPMLSADYFGRFAGHMKSLLGGDEKFTAMMSQGTSGDLWSGDYASPAKPVLDYDAYAREMATRAAAAYREIHWLTHAPLAMAERSLALEYRVPDAARLQWARDVQTQLGERLPESQPEIYALEALHLDRRKQTTLKLQALRIGDLGMTGIPNEVFCLTGLKLKARSPFLLTMNVELANGAEGYIPPPEQHALGGYTTWPARTAGLEVQAEPKIMDALLGLLEQVSGKPRRVEQAAATGYSRAVEALRPIAWWRLEEMDSGTAQDAAGDHDATVEPGVAVYLPGAAGRSWHFAGGRMQAEVPLPDAHSVAMWWWNALPADARQVTGYAWSRGASGDKDFGEHLGIGGTHDPESIGRIILYNGNAGGALLKGRTKLAVKAWHHVVLVREGDHVRVHLDGNAVPELEGTLPVKVQGGSVFCGGRADQFAGWEGKLDEISLHDRALSGAEISALYAASGNTPPVTALAPECPPLSPEDGLKSIRVPQGFQVALAAAEPLVLDPIAIDWDLAGRMWVVEMADYPDGMDGKGQAGGRIRVLEDADGDGRYKRSTLFAEGLNFPSGLLTWRDGVIVTAAPDVLFLQDTDGDGRADRTEKLITGLSEGNQQLRANGLRWGLDNRVHCAAGGHHGGHAADTVLHSHRDHGKVKTGSRDFSFDPDTGDVRPESGPSQYGRNRDDAGHWFGTQNSRALWQYVLPDAYLRRNPHVPAPDPTHLIVGPLNAPVYPASTAEKRFHSFGNAGHFTSACSGMIYRDELLWPRRDRELDAFTCEPFHNLVQHNILQEDGVTWSARRGAGEEAHDFFASTDRWCRPVMARTGPDGALWVVDMYRYIIEHPAWLPENVRADLLPLYRLGEDRGRIYRIAPAGRLPAAMPRLPDGDFSALTEALSSPNGWLRDKVHMALVWKLRAGDAAARLEWLQKSTVRMSSAPPLARLHFLCIQAGTDTLTDAAVEGGLRDPHPAVREAALRISEQHFNLSILRTAEDLCKDPDAKVRLQLALTTGAWPADGEAPHAAVGRSLAVLAARHHEDPWMCAAVLSSAMPHVEALCTGLAGVGGAALAAYENELVLLAAGTGNRAALAALLGPLVRSAEGSITAAQMRDLAGLLAALDRGKLDRAVLSAIPDELTALLAGIGNAFRVARQVLEEPGHDAPQAAAAADLLRHDPASRSFLSGILTSWLGMEGDAGRQTSAVRVLTAMGGTGVPALLLEKLPALQPVVRGAVLDALLSREAWTLALLDYLPAHPATLLDATQRARLLQNDAPAVRARAAQVLPALSPRKEVLAHYRPALELAGDAARGRQVFATRCVACHMLEGTGLAIGPDLKSVQQHPPEKILTNILDPSLDVQPGFSAFTARLRDGGELYGIITSETGNSVTLKLTSGESRLIPRSDLAALEATGQSLMPAGLEAGMELQEMADLIAWLRSPQG